MPIYDEGLEEPPEHRHIVIGGFRTLRGHVIRTLCRREMLTLKPMTDWDSGIQFIGGPKPCEYCGEVIEAQQIILCADAEPQSLRATFRLTPDLAREIDDYVERMGCTKTDVVLAAIAKYLGPKDP